MGVRQGRIKAPGQPAYAYYHCTSRVVDRRFALGEEQKNEFLKLMREYEASRWCGYGQAMAGHAGGLPRACRGAQEGLREVIAGAQRVPVENLSITEAMREYRLWLFKQGEQTEGTDAEGRPLRKGFSQEAVLEVIRQRGRVPVADYVKLRVRYFVDGVVLGTRKYVDEVFGAYRSRFGKKRKDGARRMRGVDSENLYALRDLKRDVIGVVEKAFTPRETTVGAGSPLGP